MDAPRKRPRVIVPDAYLTGVAEPLLLLAEDAAHLADFGIGAGEALIFDQAVTSQEGEVVAVVASEGAPDLPRGPLGTVR